MLNKGQQYALDHIVQDYHNGEKLLQIDGCAGTGKTYTVFEIIKTLGLRDTEILPMAYTGAASLVMRNRGFSTAKTIHSSIYELVEVPDYDNIDNRYSIPRKKLVFRKREYLDPNIKLIVVDEAGMVPMSIAKDLMSYDIPILAVGDLHQLPPVGEPSGLLINGKIYHLTEIVRQAEGNPIIYLAHRAMLGLPIHNGTYGNVLVINNDEMLPQMYGFSDIVLCTKNATRDAINGTIRNLAGFRTELPRYGERLICRKNNWQKVSDDSIPLVNGLIGTVINQVDTLNGHDKEAFALNFIPDNSIAPFIGLRANYEYFASNYEHRNSMKNLNTKHDIGEFFEYAYAITVHLSQGNEFSKGMYIENYIGRPQMQNQLNYTAITRFKDAMIYVRQKPRNYINGFSQPNKMN